MKKLFITTSVAALAAALAACGGGSGGSGGGTTIVSTPPTPSNEAKFGSQFAADFSASSNASPASVSSGDVVPPDPTATPSSVP